MVEPTGSTLLTQPNHRPSGSSIAEEGEQPLPSGPVVTVSPEGDVMNGIAPAAGIGALVVDAGSATVAVGVGDRSSDARGVSWPQPARTSRATAAEASTPDQLVVLMNPV